MKTNDNENEMFFFSFFRDCFEIVARQCVKAIMSVGDGAGKKANGDPYRLTGLVDGLGVLPHPTDASKFYVFSNHEMFANQGATRDHGSNGAYVSHMTVDKKTLTVTNLTDLVPSAAYMHSVRDGWSFLPKSFARLCSANIPSITGNNYNITRTKKQEKIKF